jgi:hypothetical protein
VADATLTKATALADNELAYLTGAIDLATSLANGTAASDAYNAAVKAAKIAHATAVGNAQVTRAGELGDALVTEATERSTAEDGYWIAQATGENSHESGVTMTELSGIQNDAAAERDYNIIATTLYNDALAEIYEADEQLAQEMKLINVAHATDLTTAEGDYFASGAARSAAAWTAFAFGSPANSASAFAAARAVAESQWISSMKSAVVTYVAAVTTAAADEVISLIQATAIAEAARFAADEAYIAAVEPLNYERTIDSAALWRAEAEAERARLGIWNTAQAAARGIQSVSYATAGKLKGVAYSTAEKTHWTGWYDLGEPSLSSNPAENPLLHAKQIAQAEANLEHATDIGEAQSTYVAGIVAGDGVYRDGRSTGYTVLETQLAAIERDLAIARLGHDQTRTQAWAAAQSAQWTAEVTAANARRTAEANAWAVLHATDLATVASAITSLDTTLSLPWTEYIGTMPWRFRPGGMARSKRTFSHCQRRSTRRRRTIKSR